MRHALSCATASAMIGFAAAPVFAQQATQDAERPPDVATLDQIVVSAQKRVTNLQETPISVSVLNDEALADRKAIGLGSLADGSIPSLRVVPFATRSSALSLSIRGIGAASDANQPARDAGVGVYVDGVFLGRSQGLGAALYDVERIEVLKGPQGTLFGRNTEGGAISIVTKAPTGEFGLKTSFGVSNYGGYNSAAHLDLPRQGDFSFKIDAVQSQRGGTTDNPMRGQEDFNSFDKRGARLSALWQPSDSFEALYAFDTSYDATTPYYIQYFGGGSYPRGPLLSGSAQGDRRDSAIIGVPQEQSIGRTDGHLLNLSWTLADNLQLKSISSYRQLTQSQYDNSGADYNSFFLAPNSTFARYSMADVYQHQYSEELQLIGNTSQLEYVAGAFYYSETAGDNARAPNTLQWNADGTAYTLTEYAQNPLSARIDRESKAWTDSLGVFGQATWTPASLQNLHVTAGGRFTRDDKKGVLRKANTAAGCDVGETADCASGPIHFDASWSRFDPMVNVAYDISDDAMVYAKWSTGFRAGGANSRSLAYRAFDPEQVKAIELGAKTQFWDNRARLNLALFNTTINDKQVDFNYNPDPTSPFYGRTIVNTVNATEQTKSKGAELEFSLKPLNSLTLSLNYAYTKADALHAVNPYLNQTVTVLPLYAPKNAGSLAVDYLLPLGAPALKFHLDGNWSDGYYASETDQTLTDDSFVVNARLAVIDVPLNGNGATAEFSLWSRNLLDEKHLFYGSQSATIGKYGIFNDPRTFGFDVSLRF